MPNKIKQFKPRGLAVSKPVDRRESAAVRGYDKAWRILRMDFMRDWVASRGPYCGGCGCPLDFGRGTHVDHIVPFDGLDDPKRLDPSNLAVLCWDCHNRKTQRERRR